ncbi:Ig-like domain-containing protein [Tautonia marina]|uniref:Ig-like domain-containing protein n=1 Tax=Tautonia marina TaxID=2653855 RepID=UPI0012608905|nr:Ig-like domain-containing protein [Tautonia marina]
MRGSMAALALAFAWLSGSSHAQEITLESVPPVVVSTVPKAGSGDVDPGLTEIRVTFSKAMQNGSWSWSMIGKDSFPETTGAPNYLEDQRTAVLPVKLMPGKTYAIWLNSQQFRNFKDAAGQPAVPYLLVFKTSE